MKTLFDISPYELQALVWLGHYVWNRRHLRSVGLDAWTSSTGEKTFLSYLFNLPPNAAATGVFESRYWGPLPSILRDADVKTNWLHLYIPDKTLPHARAAAEQIEKFNGAAARETHVTLDSFLSFKVIANALKDWIYLVKIGQRLKSSVSRNRLENINLWPLFEKDWDCSFRGVSAIGHALNLNLFETAFSCLPKQKVGVYLQENIGWEYAAIHAWRNSGHNALVGFPHSSVRFWDLRYFFDPRAFSSPSPCRLPRPDFVATHGPATRDAYLAGGYAQDELVDVEALRYLYLTHAKTVVSAEECDNRNQKSTANRVIRLLVLGEYSSVNTGAMMTALSASRPLIAAELRITVKPHPACPILARDYPNLPFSLSDSSIEELVFQNDVVLSSITTTAGLDAFCLGRSTIIYLDPQTLNLSPLREFATVAFVETPEELAVAVQQSEKNRELNFQAKNVFNLSPQLEKWQFILKL